MTDAARRSIRTIIADDERAARAHLASILACIPDVDVVGEVATGTDAVEVIERERPDLAFLDLEMPELDGLGVVRVVHKSRMPLVVFVTAHDAYAVRAFQLNAVDYLLKPVLPERVLQTIERVRARLASDAPVLEKETDRIKTTAEELRPRAVNGYLRRIPVRERNDILIVGVEQIAAVVAAGELLHIMGITGERHTIIYRLKDLEARLDPAIFVRVSRGALVNVDMIQRISPLSTGTYVVTLKNKAQLPVSRLRARVLRDELFRL